MKKRLTDRSIAALRPGTKDGKQVLDKDGLPARYDVSDPGQPGLWVRVAPSGRRTFQYLGRMPDNPHPTRRAIGTWPEVSLASARETVRAWSLQVKSGKDPQAEARAKAKAELLAEQKLAGDAFDIIAEAYIDSTVKHRRHRDAAVVIRKNLIGVWKDTPIGAISRQDVVDLIDAITAKGHHSMAYLVFGHCRALFGWAVDHRGLAASPCEKIRPRKIVGVDKAIRVHTLSDDELRAFWTACDEAPWQYGKLLQLLLLTGMRRDELRLAARRELSSDGKTFTVPLARFKGKTPHKVPLSTLAQSLIAGLPKFSEGDFIFSLNFGKAAISGFTAPKRRITARMTEILGHEPEEWCAHDLRRTMRTNLSKLRVAHEVCELAIGHARKGLDRVYSQHEFEVEIRAAMEAWGNRVRTLTTPATDNVVQLQAATQTA